MHAKYQVPIFNIAKVIANVKVGANQPTNRPTNRQGKNNMSPTTIVGDIKKEHNFKCNFQCLQAFFNLTF
jgi:hypothetical protein